VEAPPLHPDLLPLAGLLGIWRGEGNGFYPTIEGFGYREEVVFSHNGKTFLVYSQRTWSLDDGRPLHGETGFWRVPGEGRIELVLAHGTGVAEVSEGRFSEGTIEVASTALASTGTAKEVTAIERTYRLEGDTLTYELGMAAVEQPLGGHLEATLTRV
jgi:hypothetical protein